MKSRALLKPARKNAARPYKQTARAEAAQARESHILDAFQTLLSASWVEDFTLSDVARESGVTQQTVIRKFGGKEGLFRALAEKIEGEAEQRRAVAPGNVEAAIAALIEDYDIIGDLVMRLIEQEPRDPLLRPLLELGRRSHRDWIGRVFAPSLAGKSEPARKLMHDALIAATDLYLWKLLRRDFGYAPTHVAQVLEILVTGVIAGQTSPRRAGR
jgi:AcrR family transcriptional regulator